MINSSHQIKIEDPGKIGIDSHYNGAVGGGYGSTTQIVGQQRYGGEGSSYAGGAGQSSSYNGVATGGTVTGGATGAGHATSYVVGGGQSSSYGGVGGITTSRLTTERVHASDG